MEEGEVDGIILTHWNLIKLLLKSYIKNALTKYKPTHARF